VRPAIATGAVRFAVAALQRTGKIAPDTPQGQVKPNLP